MHDLFDIQIMVLPEHMDSLGHVNDVIYMQWMQNIATAHTEALGLGIKQYVEFKHAMFAVEHHLQYRQAAFVDDILIARTWLNDLNALYSFRHYAFYRPKDKNILFLGSTKLACIEINTGRSKRMSQSFLQAYQPISSNINPFDFSKYDGD